MNGNTPLFVFNNHDNVRSVNRLGNGTHKDALARMLATLMLTPRASALMYYGEELGMENDDPKRKEDVKDIVGIRGWPEDKGRDGERKPMQWNGDTTAGFSTSQTPWLSVAPGYEKVNVSAETRDPASLLNYYKALLRLRKSDPALRDGDFALLNEDDPSVLLFVRRAPDGTAALIALNCTPEAHSIAVRGLPERSGKVLLSSFAAVGTALDTGTLQLPPYGALVARLAR